MLSFTTNEMVSKINFIFPSIYISFSISLQELICCVCCGKYHHPFYVLFNFLFFMRTWVGVIFFQSILKAFANISDRVFCSVFRSRIYFGDYVRDRCREDMSNPYYSIPQTQSSTHHHHHQQQSVATSTADVEQLNNNSNSSNNNNLVISPPSSLQLHPSSQTSLTSSSTASATSNQQQQQTITPSVLYTVQRVVSTSQLQQLPSNYGNNSNASSLTNIIARNETDCGLPNNNGESLLHTKLTIFPSSSSFSFPHVVNYNYRHNYPKL